MLPIVSDLHYCVLCLDIYQSPVDLDMPLSVYAFSTSWCSCDMYIKLHLCRVLEASGSILVVVCLDVINLQLLSLICPSVFMQLVYHEAPVTCT